MNHPVVSKKSENCAVPTLLCHPIFVSFLCTLAAPDFGFKKAVGVSRCGPYATKNQTSDNFEEAETSGLRMTSSTGCALLNRIKERLLMMDLINQMDKAKELTHFVLTHQAIPREDKE